MHDADHRNVGADLWSQSQNYMGAEGATSPLLSIAETAIMLTRPYNRLNVTKRRKRKSSQVSVIVEGSFGLLRQALCVCPGSVPAIPTLKGTNTGVRV